MSIGGLRLLQAVADGELQIVPKRFEKIYNYWLENIKVCTRMRILSPLQSPLRDTVLGRAMIRAAAACTSLPLYLG